ncbi:MAG: hypothetical protein GF383_11995 [Candidatus Lokiarchaeota archaeon]|nr:hypothetical protein [Candidatus Lokiarchaeota archaeon]MBD3341607.1 hypothetical protein [Candidatus Lokiarchaeota archaeon]
MISTPSNATTVEVPTTCETCGTNLTNEGTKLYCPNEECPKRRYHRLQKWIKKLGVKHFSEKLILKNLFDNGKVKQIADLYDLHPNDLTKFEGVGQRSAQKALTNLLAVEEVPLERFIAAFDIEGIGERLVKKVVSAGFDTLDSIKNASISQLSKIDGFAEITTTTLIQGVNDLYPQMTAVLDANKIKIKKRTKPMTQKLKDLKFCFTGKLDTMKRAEAQTIVEEQGGEFKSSVTKDLDYLVTNDTTPTAKYKKAQAQDTTQVITEQEFLQMLE